MTEAYPLAWPDGWPRTKAGQHKDGRMTFGRQAYDSRGKKPLTFAQARDSLYEALRKLGARDVVLSTNFTLNSRGEPHGGRGRPADEGVAVYFKRKGRDLVLAQDGYWRAEENMRSLAIALEAMAQLERHGGDLLTEKAFTGFTALPAPPKWWEILGVSPEADPQQIQAAYRSRARNAHPDSGGTHAAMAALNAALDEARKAGKP